MLTTLQLTNFMGYRTLNLELAPFTVILGSNACGKSSLLRAISLLLKGRDVVTQLLPDEMPDPFIIRNSQLDELADTFGGWDNLFTRTPTETTEHLAIHGRFVCGGRTSCIELSVHRSSSGDLDIMLQAEALSKGFSPSGTSSAIITHVSTLHLNEVMLSDDELRKSLGAGKQSGIVRNQLVRLAPEAIKRLNRILRKIANAEIVFRTPLADSETGGPLEVYYSRGGTTFEIATANHALISSLVLLCEIETKKSAPMATEGHLLLLDEPEIHLFPSAEIDLAKHLCEVSRAEKTQIISVTHSDHMVRYLLTSSDCTVLNIEQPFSRFRRIHTQEHLLKARPHELSSYSAVNFLVSRRVLFVEGGTDETILARCAIAHLGDQPDRLSRFEAWTRVPLGGVTKAPGQDLFERLLLSEMMPDLRQGEKLIVATISDRDYERSPIKSIEQGIQVDSIVRVWSRHSIESLFIDVDVLESLLLAVIKPPASTGLRNLIQAAIAAADVEPILCESAEDELAEHFRRTRQYSGKEAQSAARLIVRSSPADWQRGKDRAAYVLRHVRTSLPISVQNKVRSSIAKMIQSIPPAILSQVDVPAEIVELLEVLVAPALPKKF
jgi:energy-coupling factor transporter ATP-binding protein EcfA2